MSEVSAIGLVGRLPRLALVAAMLAAGFAAGLGAMALATSENGVVYHACVNNGSGTIKMIGESGTCGNNEVRIVWNQQGPEGEKGDIGDPGKDGDDGEKGDTGDRGEPGLVWQGDWDGATSYAARDAVSYQGSSYVAVEENIGKEPDENPEWHLLARKGDTGEKGDKGDQGLPGPSGMSQAYASLSGNTGLRLAGTSDTQHHVTVAETGPLPGGQHLVWVTVGLTNFASHTLQDNSRDVRCYFEGFPVERYPVALGGSGTYDMRATLSFHRALPVIVDGGSLSVKCYADADGFIGDSSGVIVNHASVSTIRPDHLQYR